MTGEFPFVQDATRARRQAELMASSPPDPHPHPRFDLSQVYIHLGLGTRARFWHRGGRCRHLGARRRQEGVNLSEKSPFPMRTIWFTTAAFVGSHPSCHPALSWPGSMPAFSSICRRLLLTDLSFSSVIGCGGRSGLPAVGDLGEHITVTQGDQRRSPYCQAPCRIGAHRDRQGIRHLCARISQPFGCDAAKGSVSVEDLAKRRKRLVLQGYY